MSDAGSCERCGEEPHNVTLICDGRVWGKFCQNCHDTLSAVAGDIAEVDGAKQ